jgi:hypothetical protein
MMTAIPSRAKLSIPQVLALFQALLPLSLVRTWMQAAGVCFYERLFTPLIVVWCMLYQRLQADHSLDVAVSQVAGGMVDCLDQGERAPVAERLRSQNTAAYSKARRRMPLSVLQQVVCRFAEAGQEQVRSEHHWHGHEVILLDGSTLAMRPYGDLAAHYGLQRNQHGTSYWVVMRLVVAFCLHSGGLLWAEEGPCTESEQSLAKKVLAHSAQGSVWVADRNFGVFSVAQAARHYGQQVLLRLQRNRVRGLAKRTLHPNDDLLVQWTPSAHDQYDAALSVEPIAGRLLYVRLEREGFRPIDLHLFTTLCDSTSYPLEDLVALYGQRWHVELDLRYVKSTLDMQLLQAKSVAMIQKELWAGLAAYNLVRVFMAMAAHQAALTPTALSFTQCWRRVRNSILSGDDLQESEDPLQPYRGLLARLAQCRLQKRKGFRIEPRAVRLRSRQYQALRGPRDQARQKTLQKLLAEPAKC